MNQKCRRPDPERVVPVLMRLKQTAQAFGLDPRTVSTYVAEMEASGRYPENFVCRDKGYVLIEYAAFWDYLYNRKALRGPGKIYVAPYIRKQPEPVIVLGGTK